MANSVLEIDSVPDILLRKDQAAEYCQKRFPHITVDTITHHVYKKKTLARPIIRDHKAYWPTSALDAWLNESF
ncbi:hypothetical protein ACXPWS_11530 [Mycobacterium sp. BMJ-28]